MKHFFRTLVSVTVACFFLSCGDTQTTSSTPQKSAEGLPGLSLSTPAPVINEGDSAVIVIGMNRGLPANTDLVWEVLAGAERFQSSNGTIVLPAGATNVILSVATLENLAYDGELKARVRVRDAAGRLAPVEIFIGITDNDPMPFVSIADQEGVRGGRIDLAIELSAASNLETVVGWKTIDATAVSGTDYIGGSGTARIPPGETRAIVGVTTLPMARDSNFTLKLISVENAAFADSSATAHILPGNNLNTKISFAAASSTVTEGPTTADVVLQLSNAIGADVSVDLLIDGDAMAGSDYSAIPLTVTIPAGSMNVSIPVQILDDGIFEREETIRLRLKSSTNASFGLQTSHTIYVRDNDAEPTISVSDAQALEGRALSFSVSINQVSGADTTFSYLTMNGTAGMADYTQVAGTVTIPRGQTVARVSVPTTADTLHEENEDLTLLLSEANGATLLRASARGIIIDDDTAPTVQFSSASQTVDGSVSQVTVPISLSFVSGANVSIPFHVGGTAVEGLDHNLSSGVVSIPPGQSGGTISFSVIRHGPPARTAVITMDAASGASLGSQTEHVVQF